MAPAAPGKVQAIAIMQLVCGIQTILVAVGIAIGTLFLYLPWVFALVLGIMAIVRGSKLMGSGAYGAGNSKAIPIMFIINILNCDAIGLVVGIVCLVFQAEPEVADYLDGVSEMEMEMDV